MTNINIQTDGFSFGLDTNITNINVIKSRINQILDAVFNNYSVRVGNITNPAERIRSIKAIRTVTNCGLKEGKDIVDTLVAHPGTVLELPPLVMGKADAMKELSPYFTIIE